MEAIGPEWNGAVPHALLVAPRVVVDCGAMYSPPPSAMFNERKSSGGGSGDLDYLTSGGLGL